MATTLAILTDFGTLDPYVGIMKGVIAQIAPSAKIIDLTHEISPGDIARGAFVLWQARAYFPAGTIFLVVIDPGVGTARQPIILHSGGYTYVGPDNGVFSYILADDAHAWRLENPAVRLPEPGNTFHGRDIFAPAAAHAARGVPASKFGASHPDLERLPPPRLAAPAPGTLRGQVMHADHFGNLITSFGKFTQEDRDIWQFQPWVGDAAQFRLSSHKAYLRFLSGTDLGWVQTFAQIPGNQCGILVGSTGLIEIVANRQSAANLLNLGPGDPLTLHYSIPTGD